MKKFLYALLSMLILIIAGCRKKELEFTEAAKPLNGTWKIVKAVRNGEDMTTLYDFSAFRINFSDSTYTITDPVPFVVNKNGKWHFDDPQYPLELSMQADGSATVVKPVLRYPVVKGNRNLVLTFSPGCITNKYEYTLEPLPQ